MTEQQATPCPERAWVDSRAHRLFWITTAVTLAVDLVSKFLAFRYVPWGDEGILVIPGLLKLQLRWNRGAVFGQGEGLRWVFIVATVAAVWFLVHIFAQSRRRQWVLHVLLALSLGGALGNLYDRVVSDKGVRDFLLVNAQIGSWSVWPYVFNIADAALVVGIGCLLAGWTFGWIEIQSGVQPRELPVARPCEQTDDPTERVE